MPCKHILRGLRHSVYPNQVPVIWWGYVHLDARVVCGSKHHARDSRHAGVLGRRGSVYVRSLVFVWRHVGGDRKHVHADAGAHALCFLGSIWCLERHFFLYRPRTELLHMPPRRLLRQRPNAPPPPPIYLCMHACAYAYLHEDRLIGSKFDRGNTGLGRHCGGPGLSQVLLG